MSSPGRAMTNEYDSAFSRRDAPGLIATSRHGKRHCFTTSSRKTSCTFCTRTCRSVRHNSSCTRPADRCIPCSSFEPVPHCWRHRGQQASAGLLQWFSRFYLLSVLKTGTSSSWCSQSCPVRHADPWQALVHRHWPRNEGRTAAAARPACGYERPSPRCRSTAGH